MKVLTKPIRLGIFLIFLSTYLPAWAQADLAMSGLLPQESAASAREDELHKDGSDALNERKWDAAARKFSQAAEVDGKRAESALYWKAYGRNKGGHRQEARA